MPDYDQQRVCDRPTSQQTSTGNPIVDGWTWLTGGGLLEATHEAVDQLLDPLGFGNSGLHDLLFGDHEQSCTAPHEEEAPPVEQAEEPQLSEDPEQAADEVEQSLEEELGPEEAEELLEQGAEQAEEEEAPEEEEREPAYDPALAAGLTEEELASGANGDSVSSVQNVLVALGYLTAEQVATGPGLYGPRTTEAIRRFQREHGIYPATGSFDANTRAWMIARLAGNPPPEKIKPGDLPDDASEANAFFVTQFYTPEWNPNGPSGSTNCGPASLAMLMNVMGSMPSGLDAEQQIDHARALMYPNDAGVTTITVDGVEVEILNEDHDLSGLGAIEEGINAAGGVGVQDSGWENLDAMLDQGSPVVLYGYLDDAWRENFPSRVGSGDIAHFNAVVGRTEDGKYIVMDPMHTGGAVEMSAEELAEFFDDGTPRFIGWDLPVQQTAPPTS